MRVPGSIGRGHRLRGPRLSLFGCLAESTDLFGELEALGAVGGEREGFEPLAVDLGHPSTVVAENQRDGLPDLTFLIDVPVEVSRSRVASRAEAAHVAIDRLEREDTEFHERVRAGYLELAREDARIVTLDGTLAPDALCETATAIVAAKFGV